ncbi:MAG: PEP-CTERM sorting domain-containing protein [Puniceicoccaceae bacterium]
MNRNHLYTFLLLVIGSSLCAQVTTLYDQDITPDVIFGSGNANGFFTVDQDNGVELGLRAKLRFDATNSPQNIFNSNGDGTYTFQAGLPPTGFAWAPGSTSTALWNFEWSINSNYDGSSSYNLDDLFYTIDIDFDPSAATNFLSFDPINIAETATKNYADHSIGDNTTGNGLGTEATDRTTYLPLIANNNVAQNSWNMEFFDDALNGFPFNGNTTGVYTFRLTAFDSSNNVLAQASIDVLAVPEPSTYAAISLVICIAGMIIRRRIRRKN